MIALQDRQITSAWSNVLGLLTLLLALAACLFFLRLSETIVSRYAGEPPAPAEPGPAEIAIGGETLHVSSALVRYPMAGKDGKIETRRLEMAFRWPSLAPLSSPGEAGIHIAITAEHDPFGERERFDRLFAPRFASAEIAGPSGLSGKRMKAGTGYGGEIVYYEPARSQGSGEHFYYARCGVPQADPVPLSCLRSLRVAPGLQASYRFDAALLGEWQLLERAVLDLVTRMRAE